jgi:hypothetical protein
MFYVYLLITVIVTRIISGIFLNKLSKKLKNTWQSNFFE